MENILGLKGKNIIVTGAAGDMGHALTELLCDAGANVYAGISRNRTNLPVAREISVNMGNQSSIDSFLEQCPESIWAVYCCHGVSCRKSGCYTACNNETMNIRKDYRFKEEER